MIVVDTSALMAILLEQPLAAECRAELVVRPEILISAGTLSEALIVAGHRGLQADMRALIEAMPIKVASVTAATAQQCAEAHMAWGKGVHPAGLNFGDCFAYALAKSNNCPLLFVGDDFSRTDITSAL